MAEMKPETRKRIEESFQGEVARDTVLEYIRTVLPALRNMDGTNVAKLRMVLSVFQVETAYYPDRSVFDIRVGGDMEVGIGQVMWFWIENLEEGGVSFDLEKVRDQVKLSMFVMNQKIDEWQKKFSRKFLASGDKVPDPDLRDFVRSYNCGVETAKKNTDISGDYWKKFQEKWVLNSWMQNADFSSINLPETSSAAKKIPWLKLAIVAGGFLYLWKRKK